MSQSDGASTDVAGFYACFKKPNDYGASHRYLPRRMAGGDPVMAGIEIEAIRKGSRTIPPPPPIEGRVRIYNHARPNLSAKTS